MPTIRSKRAPSFGIGWKTPIVNMSTAGYKSLDQVPSPGLYNALEAAKKIQPHKAFSFGVSRAAYSKVFLRHHPTYDPSIPGPGTYASKTQIGQGGLKCSLKPKAKNLSACLVLSSRLRGRRRKSGSLCLRDRSLDQSSGQVLLLEVQKLRSYKVRPSRIKALFQ